MVKLLRTSPAPPVARQLNVWVLHTGAQLHGLRTALHQALTGIVTTAGPALDDRTERMALVATELATNAIKYGRPPTVVQLLLSDTEFILDVADHDLETIFEPVDTRPGDAGGRGLMLAQAFSQDIGWYTTDTTKHIWASFPAQP